MTWELEQDVLYMLLHLMGKVPSLEEALRLGPEDLAVDRLRKRAVQLHVAQEAGQEIAVHPAIRPLLNLASDATDIIEVLPESNQDPPKADRYYYLGGERTVVVEREDMRLLLRQVSQQAAVEEIAALLGVGKAKPETGPIAVPLATRGGVTGSAPSPEDLATFLDLMGNGDLWFIVRLSQGRTQEVMLIVTKDGAGWMLRQQDEQALALWPIGGDDVKAAVGSIFVGPQGE